MKVPAIDMGGTHIMIRATGQTDPREEEPVQAESPVTKFMRTGANRAPDTAH